MLLESYRFRLEKMIWSGQFWGENGALEYARQNSDLINLDKFGLLSLRYSASGNAWMHWRKNPLAFWWLFRFILLFPRVLLKAKQLSRSLHLLSAGNCSVVGAVLAQGGFKELAVKVFERGVYQPDVSFETTALLYGDLFNLHAMPKARVWEYVWGVASAPDWEVAQKPRGRISKQQLARVLRKIGLDDLAKKTAEGAGSADQVLKASA